MSKRTQELVEIEGLLIDEVGASYYVTVDGKEHYLPKSLTTIEDREQKGLVEKVTLTIPEWLAIKEGLV